ncbi:rh41 [macacine betaherpesvirus 3]|uniref:Rh41 n=1 Tax=Rhesus cytomegalovirus (strain 68-1) TaxID=47929 RepID=Q2FAS9_RHCM6|nr:rh41 [macacine betaherpesvirus 3]
MLPTKCSFSGQQRYCDRRSSSFSAFRTERQRRRTTRTRSLGQGRCMRWPDFHLLLLTPLPLQHVPQVYQQNIVPSPTEGKEPAGIVALYKHVRCVPLCNQLTYVSHRCAGGLWDTRAQCRVIHNLQ